MSATRYEHYIYQAYMGNGRFQRAASSQKREKLDLDDAAACLLCAIFPICQELLGQHQQPAQPV